MSFRNGCFINDTKERPESNGTFSNANIIRKLSFNVQFLMNRVLRWKLDEHSDLVKYGRGHSLLLDLVSISYRRRSYKKWVGLISESASSQGFSFTEKTPPVMLREIFLLGIYNVKGFTPENGDVVVDVGANYGDSAIWWARKFGVKVFAFEPLSDVFEEFEKNIKLNAVDVVAFNEALGEGEEITGHSVGGMFAIGGNSKVKTEKLDKYSFERVDLLKIDVEGFEYNVLKGAENTIRKFKPRIIIETHTHALRDLCHSYLSEHGYQLKVEGRTISTGIKGMDKVTNLFYST